MSVPEAAETQWNKFDDAIPVPAVQIIPVDKTGRVLVMHRSNNVRSAKNIWSFPSGLHDIGKTWWEVAQNEMTEEYGLKLLRAHPIGTYENIAGDAGNHQWHWVVHVVTGLVEDITKSVNKEPDKHDRMEYVPLADLLTDAFWTKHPFHKSFVMWGYQNRNYIVRALGNTVMEVNDPLVLSNQLPVVL